MQSSGTWYVIAEMSRLQGDLGDVGQEVLVPLQGHRQTEGEPQVVAPGLLLEVDEDGGGGQGLHTAGDGGVGLCLVSPPSSQPPTSTAAPV